MIIKYKLCPFCGQHPEHMLGGVDNKVMVRCSHCMGTWMALAQWNNRPFEEKLPPVEIPRPTLPPEKFPDIPPRPPVDWEDDFELVDWEE